MTHTPLDRQFTVTNGDSWDPEAILDLQRRLNTLSRRRDRLDRAIRITLQHENYADPDMRFGVSTHVDMRGRTLHAHAFGPTEYHASAELEQRLQKLLEHERERRWWARHHNEVVTHTSRKRMHQPH